MKNISCLKAFTALSLGAVIMLTTACTPSTGTTPENNTSVTATAIATDSAANSTLPVKGIANDGKGDFLQTAISPDDVAFKYDPSIVKGTATDRFSVEDITAAQKVAVTFIAEEALDSTMSGNPKDKAVKDAWWEKNKDKFYSSSQEEFHKDVLGDDANKPIVFRGYFRSYDLAYGKDKTHLNSYTIKPVEVHGGDVNGLPAVAFKFEVTFKLNVVVDGKEKLETTKAEVNQTLVKDKATGEFKFTGYYSKFSTTPVK